ncbi:hypothetical protein J2Z79_002389 [Symbiobacterium terraclitae]|uniref:Uncharacterized protein n=1 Tax=Symbiobacterium terraclitae TaxID=557451 RepID=A0ABS4JTW1_9FIRM|nr:hypothetical protein [Symbiobacterium terraclitae]
MILEYARAHPEEFLFDGVVYIPASEPTVVHGQFMFWLFP